MVVSRDPFLGDFISLITVSCKVRAIVGRFGSELNSLDIYHGISYEISSKSIKWVESWDKHLNKQRQIDSSVLYSFVVGGGDDNSSNNNATSFGPVIFG
jgi:hypothetical protein